MNNQWGFILKIFIFSGLLSYLIKYVAPLFEISPNTVNALVAVITPVLVLTLILGWRFLRAK